MEFSFFCAAERFFPSRMNDRMCKSMCSIAAVGRISSTDTERDPGQVSNTHASVSPRVKWGCHIYRKMVFVNMMSSCVTNMCFVLKLLCCLNHRIIVFRTGNRQGQGEKQLVELGRRDWMHEMLINWLILSYVNFTSIQKNRSISFSS